jgi:hypothetical protein
MSQKPKRRRSPQLEPLEGKLLLSGAKAAAAAAKQAEIATADGAFSIAGTLRMPVSSIATFQISGQHLGTYTLSGKLASTGQVSGRFFALLDSTNTYMSAGEMGLSNKHGSVLIALTSDKTNDNTYDFTIKSGTGTFAGATGTGKMTTSVVSANGKTMSFVLTMNPAS